MNSRQISVFNYLLEQNNYVTAKTISKEFNVTPKTIYIDINILQQELAEYGLIVDKKTNCGILSDYYRQVPKRCTTFLHR